MLGCVERGDVSGIGRDEGLDLEILMVRIPRVFHALGGWLLEIGLSH